LAGPAILQAPSPSKTGEALKPQDSRSAQKHAHKFKRLLYGFFWALLLLFLSSKQPNSHGWITLKHDHKISSKWAKALIKTVKGKV
jgi:hypothetical protein